MRKLAIMKQGTSDIDQFLLNAARGGAYQTPDHLEKRSHERGVGNVGADLQARIWVILAPAMIHRRIRFAPIVLLLVAAFTLPGTITATKAEESYTLRIASLAPAGSSWMKVLNAWNKTLQEKTNGRLKIRFYPGGSQGDERDFVRKMRVGQLDGGVVTMTGMSMVVRAMIVLVLPGFLDTYEELDRVRAKMAPQFEAMFEKEGFKLVAWGDAGKNRLFSAKPFRAAL